MEKTCDVLSDLEILIRARYPIIYIVSWEEMRVTEWVRSVAKKRNKRVYEWSSSTGIYESSSMNNMAPPKSRASASIDPIKALDEVMSQVEPAIYVFKDFHPYLADRSIRRKVKEVSQHVKNSFKTVIFLSPVLEVPPELDKEITVVDYPLPEATHLSQLLDRILNELKNQPDIVIDINPAAREQLIHAALGLTLNEAENVFAKILVSDRKLTADDVAAVFAEKQQITRKSGLLDYYATDIQPNDVGGLDLLKDWLARRASAFTDRAREFGLPPPKGVFLLGVQGCGKSLSAKAVSAMWKMPLLRLDIGRMFGSLVGSSEENMRRALQVAESIAPVALWLDEIDKAMSGTRSSGSTDSGTTARVFGTFLTWLSEKKSPVFVIATANDISNLPPELLRKGRFDDIFFVDLPNFQERRDIFKIHIRSRKRNPDNFDLDKLASAAEGFSGAEIEESVISALFDAFSAETDLETTHIEKAIQETVPLSKTMEGDLNRLRSWADGRARPASTRDDQNVVHGRKLEL